MADYGCVSPNYWTGETGRLIRKLGADPQLIGVYLMTNNHRNALGLYYLPKIFISHETALSLEGASKGLQRLCEGGFCAYDNPSEFVWVYEMAKFQIADALKPNDNRVKWINEKYRIIPKNPFLGPFFDRYGEAFHLKRRRAFEPPSKPDTVTDTVTDTDDSKAFFDKSKKADSVRPSLNHFSEKVGSYFDPIFEACQKINALPRKKQKFNPYEWVQKKANGNKHPGAILYCLNGLISYWDGIGKPWGYADDIMKTKNGNFNEAEAVEAAKAFKADWAANDSVKKLLKGIG